MLDRSLEYCEVHKNIGYPLFLIFFEYDKGGDEVLDHTAIWDETDFVHET